MDSDSTMITPEDFNRSLETFTSAIDEYLTVASRFFSTSIEEDENSLRKAADQIVELHSWLQFFALAEGAQIVKFSANKLTDNLEEIGKLLLSLDSPQEENISSLKAFFDQYKVVNQYLLLEKRFIDCLLAYLNGLSVIILEYHTYMVKQLRIPLPQSIEKFKKRLNWSKLLLALSFLGLVLTILGFHPYLSIPMGVISLVLFLIEHYYLAGKSLKNLKQMPALAQETRNELDTLRLHIEALRTVQDFITNWNTYLPEETLSLIDNMKAGKEIDADKFESQCHLLEKKIMEIHFRNWPGIGKVLERGQSR